MADDPGLTLYVKAPPKPAVGQDDLQLGADVFAQRFMMMLVLKDVSVNIVPVDVTRDNSMKKLPALELDEELIEDPGKIEEFLERLEPHLTSNDKNVNELVVSGYGSKVYHSFCKVMKSTETPTEDNLKKFMGELKNLDSFLRPDKMPGKYLGGDSMLLPDCILLPKLLHIKVVSKALINLEIPEEFEGIHRYMDAAYGKDDESFSKSVVAFTKTCPSEDVIVDAWARSVKFDNPLLHRKKKPTAS